MSAGTNNATPSADSRPLLLAIGGIGAVLIGLGVYAVILLKTHLPAPGPAPDPKLAPMVRDYLRGHPKALRATADDLDAGKLEADAPKIMAAIATHRQAEAKPLGDAVMKGNPAKNLRDVAGAMEAIIEKGAK